MTPGECHLAHCPFRVPEIRFYASRHLADGSEDHLNQEMHREAEIYKYQSKTRRVSTALRNQVRRDLHVGEQEGTKLGN